MRIPLAVSVLLLGAGPFSAEPQKKIIVCDFERIAIAEQDKDGSLKSKAEGSKGTIIIAGLDTDRPTLRGNVDEVGLRVLPC